MNTNNLTDRSFWLNYWNSKVNVLQYINSKYIFSDIFTKVCSKYKIKSSIELGGFPGYFSVFVNKHCSVKNVSLLDFCIIPELVNKLEDLNEIDKNTINLIEADLNNINDHKTYDLVFSCGLIEHFKDTDDIIKKHTMFLSDKGVLLIIIPNFKGINGWFQKNFDRKNYDSHYLDCMDLEYLRKALDKNNISVSECDFYGGFSVWLENEDKKHIVAKILKKVVWLLGKITYKIYPFKNKWFSPYIFIYGQKK